jgi:catechol 2,3-dioxygenase-like lactoylglutathione lyase family enzyme
MRVESLDHLVLTVADVEASAAFYVQVLGMEKILFGQGRVALAFGSQKINLHPAAAPLSPHAAHPTPGSGDLCFVTGVPLPEWVDLLAACGVAVEAGPVARTGALGAMTSLYFRDPDGNLIEVARYGEACGG